MSASGGKADIPDTPHQCPLMTRALTPLRFLGSVAVLPPIVAAHVIASQSDALPGLQVASE